MQVVASAMARLPHLTSLNMAGNELGDEGCVELATAAGQCMQLMVLDFADTGTRRDGAVALATATVHLPAMASLLLDDNLICKSGVCSHISLLVLRRIRRGEWTEVHSNVSQSSH